MNANINPIDAAVACASVVKNGSGETMLTSYCGGDMKGWDRRKTVLFRVSYGMSLPD